jgi:hypothetical protein
MNFDDGQSEPDAIDRIHDDESPLADERGKLFGASLQAVAVR